MLAVISAIALSAATIAVLAAVMALAERMVTTTSTEDLVDDIDDILPQTQCAQCGYPGCRPYAEAVLAGAPINLCPPGGERAVAALAELLGRSAEPLVARVPAQVVARIDPAACIGCTLCLPACPVDAIVGANGYLHGVLEADCTGCELCIAPCPVDCITLLPLTSAAQPSDGRTTP